MPKVSVVIPNFNHARYLRQRIDSVLGQTYKDFEVILMDDCSTDESRSIISEYAKDPRVRVELNETNSGSTFKQWNKGVRLAQGQYVWIAESDDYADERLLERLVGVLETDQEATFAYCRSWRIREECQRDGFGDWYLEELDPERWKRDFRADGRQECANWFVFSNIVPNASCVVFRKAMYERMGGADERLRVCGDWKLWASMASEGKIAYIAEPLNYHREHSGTVRSQVLQTGQGAREHLAMVRWMLKRTTPDSTILDKTYSLAARLWIPPLFNRSLPLGSRLRLLGHANATDPRAIRRVIRELRTRIRLKLAKEFRHAQ